MICPKCNRENEDGALFCRHCGSSMNPVQNPKESNISSVLILVWVIAVAVLSLATYCYTRFIDNWYSDAKTGYVILQLIHNVVMILPALAIKNKVMKIVGIIVMSLMIIWWIVQNIQFMMETL